MRERERERYEVMLTSRKQQHPRGEEEDVFEGVYGCDVCGFGLMANARGWGVFVGAQYAFGTMSMGTLPCHHKRTPFHWF